MKRNRIMQGPADENPRSQHYGLHRELVYCTQGRKDIHCEPVAVITKRGEAILMIQPEASSTDPMKTYVPPPRRRMAANYSALIGRHTVEHDWGEDCDDAPPCNPIEACGLCSDTERSEFCMESHSWLERDPRIDPVKGDVVRGNKLMMTRYEREVVATFAGSLHANRPASVSFTVLGLGGLRTVPLADWRDWSRYGEVIKRGEEPKR